MIDRYPNKVAIKSQDRLQPMDKWEDYPIKVLDMAPLIMVTLPTLSSLFSTCGCFLRVERSFSEDLPLLSLACGWPLGANGPLCLSNGGASTNLGLKVLRVQEKGAEPTPGVGQAGRFWSTGPGTSRPGSVAPSLPWVLMCLCTLPPPFALFWRCHPRFQDGGSPCMKFSLLRFHPRGCSFVALRSLPPLEVISSSSWTRTRLLNCSFELVVNPSFMSMFSYINITLPNAHTKMNLLYD
jgi:hypothetical protein